MADSEFVQEFDQEVAARYIELTCNEEITLERIKRKGSFTGDWSDFQARVKLGDDELFLPASFAQGTHRLEFDTDFVGTGIVLEGENIDKVTGVNLEPVDLADASVQITIRDFDEIAARQAGDATEAFARQAGDQSLQSAIDGINSVPPGGIKGQVLTKNSGSDYDVIWATAAGAVAGIFIMGAFFEFTTNLALPLQLSNAAGNILGAIFGFAFLSNFVLI